MASQATQIAEAVKVEMNATTFTLAFTSVRLYLPLFDFHQMDDLHVTVASNSTTSELVARDGSVEEVHQVDVAVQKRLAGNPAAEATNGTELDALVELAEDIGQHFRVAGALPGFTSARYAGHAVQPLYDPGLLKTQKLFTSVITLNFNVQRNS